MQTDRLQRVLMLGAGGLMGTALRPELERAGIAVDGPPSQELDIRDLDGLHRRVADGRPQMLLNLAALSSVDRAEREPDLAYAINSVGAHNAALAAQEAGIPLLHVSTDYVFDGMRCTPYREFHGTGEPPNHYGRSKLHAELLVRDTCRRHFIVRVAALFGEGRPDFVDMVLQRATDVDHPLTVVADRFVSPTWTVDLARQVLGLMHTPYFGTYHATGHGVASWFELARSALELSGHDPRAVVAIPDLDLASHVVRAPYTVLDNHLLRLRGLDTMLTWREGLTRHLSGA